MSDTAIALKSTDKVEKRMEIRGKLRQAVDAMVWDGLEWNEAAKQFNFDVRAMRNALARPHVVAYLRSERQVLRESLSPRNIHRLREIRDAADNMPAIQAIRTLEQMGDDTMHGNGAVTHSPGLTIRIINQVAAAPMVDVTPTRIEDAE
jgi:hypothetical protein